jgi:CRISPR-associated protein (TIGR03985 family)
MLKIHHITDLPVLQRLGQFSPADKDQGNNLRKAIRMWYSLRELDGQFVPENKRFTDQDWRNHLYKEIVKNRDKLPEQRLDCISNKNIPNILFGVCPQQNGRWQDWKQQFAISYRSNHSQSVIDDYLQSIESIYPFYVTGKTILNDLEHLSAVGFLQKVDVNTFQVASNPPVIEPAVHISAHSYEPEASVFLAEDFDSYQYCFAAPLQGIHRFYIHGEYRSVNGCSSGLIQQQLQQIWANPKRLPIELLYRSSSKGRTYQEIIYPLLIHYYQRAFYLCAYGQSEKGWHNYRIDRIEQIHSLAWSDSLVEKGLSEKFEASDDQEQIEAVQEAWESAYGGDFYQPEQVMLLRFDRDFHDRYIQNTFRHQTFKKVDFGNIGKMLYQQSSHEQEVGIALERCQAHPRDAYYRMTYRIDDHSVLMRLRAWSPNMEVLFPLDLRQQMATDIHKAAKFY